MAELLKTFFSPALVRRLATDIARVHPSFPVRAFVRQTCAGLDELELLDRGKHIARALEAHLPETYPDALSILLRSLGPEHSTDELIGVGPPVSPGSTRTRSVCSSGSSCSRTIPPRWCAGAWPTT